MIISGLARRRAGPASVVLVLFVVGLAGLFGIYVGLERTDLLPLVLLGLAAALVGLAVLSNWRRGLYVLLVWIVLEDLPRKYLGNNMLIFFSKDAVATLVYLAFLTARTPQDLPRLRPRFLLPLILFAAWAVVEVLNPNSPSPLYGLIGLRLYFFYVPLMFVGYALVRDEKDLRRFLRFNLAVAAIVGALGIAQGVIGLDFLNPPNLAPELALAKLVRQAPITGALVPRPTSVFVSDGRFAWYMLVMFLLGIGSLVWLWARRDRATWGVAGALGIIVAAIVMSGSRGTFMYMLGSTAVFTAAMLWGSRARLRPTFVRALLPGLAFGGLGLVVVLALFPEAVGARWSFYYETIAPWSPTSELSWRVWNYPITNFLGAFTYPGWPLGHGTGTSSLGVQYVTRLFGLPAPDIGVESGYGTLILELGVPGLTLWLLWTSVLVREGWRVVRRLRGSVLFPVGFAIGWFAFLLLFPFTFGGMQPYQNYVFNAYLWLLLGILWRLPEVRKIYDRT
jgi:hypothetical protein